MSDPTGYFTPLGVFLMDEEIEDGERIVCDNCQLAVIEDDEFIPCADCDASWCLYCWQSWGWRCDKCGSEHYRFRAEKN